MNKAWGDLEVWQALAQAGRRVTPTYYLHALDLRMDADGGVTQQPEAKRIYRALFVKTIGVSLAITLLCLGMGYPLAWFIAHSPPRRGRRLLMLVLLPWESPCGYAPHPGLCCCSSRGVLNSLLTWAGVVADDQRLTLMHNMTGTFVAMPTPTCCCPSWCCRCTR